MTPVLEGRMPPSFSTPTTAAAHISGIKRGFGHPGLMGRLAYFPEILHYKVSV
jgi:hypothetical protein